MDKFLKKLREKPEKERRKILITTSLGITLIIFAFWLANIRTLFSNNGEEVKTADTSPFSILKSNLGNAYESIKSSFSVVK